MDIGAACIGLGIRRGAILHSKKFDFVDHGKLFVIIGESEDDVIGFFFINSNINNFIQRNPGFFAMQMQLKRSDYPDILHYDSYLDCHELTPIPKKELIKQIEKREAVLKGCLTDADREHVMDVIRESALFSAEEKDRFFK